ncbi:hypothetical protein MRB53_010420 [Persea americana]|uniref:Uncharacterized protein n=1 Tax=Persea americana TaxID=3435 RepID=A0ACC2LSI2_PERAE|nr:hypothetical protein MRB53_010420 [Persea americana]
MEEQLYSLQLSQIKLKDTSKLHGKMPTKILQCLENLRSAEISTGKASQANLVVVEPGLRHCSSQDNDLIGFCGSGQSVSSEDDLIRIADPHLFNYGNVGLGDPHPCNSGNGVLSVQENHHVESILMKDFVFWNENVVDYEKLITEILRCLESLRTAENSIWKISQANHPAVEKDIHIGQPNLTSLVKSSPTHHHYIDHPNHSSNEEDLRMEEVEDGFLSLVEVAKAAANKRKMDDVAAIGQIEGSYTAVVRGSKSLPWQQQTTLDTASKLTITMPSDAAYDDSFSKSLRNSDLYLFTMAQGMLESSYQLVSEQFNPEMEDYTTSQADQAISEPRVWRSSINTNGNVRAQNPNSTAAVATPELPLPTPISNTHIQFPFPDDVVKVSIDGFPIKLRKCFTVLQVCKVVGIDIPRSYYHSLLFVVENCHLCLIEVEKSPKPVISCAMPCPHFLR